MCIMINCEPLKPNFTLLIFLSEEEEGKQVSLDIFILSLIKVAEQLLV